MTGSNSTRKVKYSFVLPVFNEVDNLGILLTELNTTIAEISAVCEIIFVDDHSTDGSGETLHKYALEQQNIRTIRFVENRGQSAALSAGFQLAAGEYVITLDSDLQNDVRDILKMLAHIPDYDMVTGSRVKRNDSWIKKLDSRIANFIRNKLTRENIWDTGCSLKIMRRDLLNRIKMFKGMHRFLPTLMKMEGASVLEIPVSHRPRTHGDSKYGTWDRAISGFRDLLVVRWMQDRFIEYKIEEFSDEH